MATLSLSGGTTIDEIAARIYRISTPVEIPGGGGFSFNQYLIEDDEPLLFHTGLRRLGHDSKMVVARKLGGDGEVLAFQPKTGAFAQVKHKLRARKIYWQYEAYRATIPAGLEPFSDDRTPYAGELLEQIPDADIINLHWVAGLIDHENFFPRIGRDTPIVWRLADMAALTGGC